MAHPTDEQLERFAQVSASRAENRLIVVHLLRGCPNCAAKIRKAIDPEIAEEAYDPTLDKCQRSCHANLESLQKRVLRLKR